MDSQPGTKSGASAEFSVYVGNLDTETSLSDLEELIYELFLQAGPLSHVHIPFNKTTGKPMSYGFVEFLHHESVPYAIGLMNGIRLCGKFLKVRPTTGRASGNSATPKAATPSSSDGGAMDIQQSPAGPFDSVGVHAELNFNSLEATNNPFFAALSQNKNQNGHPMPKAVMTVASSAAISSSIMALAQNLLKQFSASTSPVPPPSPAICSPSPGLLGSPPPTEPIPPLILPHFLTPPYLPTPSLPASPAVWQQQLVAPFEGSSNPPPLFPPHPPPPIFPGTPSPSPHGDDCKVADSTSLLPLPPLLSSHSCLPVPDPGDEFAKGPPPNSLPLAPPTELPLPPPVADLLPESPHHADDAHLSPSLEEGSVFPPLLPPPPPLPCSFPPPPPPPPSLFHPLHPPPPLSSTNSPDLEFGSPLPFDPAPAHPHRLHQSRLHANDHPPWLKDEVRDKISNYHLSKLRGQRRHCLQRDSPYTNRPHR